MRTPAWLLAMMCALATASASATVIHVDAGGGGDFVTIQEGIDAASEGDTVLVAAGTYSGVGNRDLDLGGTNLVLLGAGRDSTIIECGGSSVEPHRGFHFHSGEDSTSVVRGFTVSQGWAVSGSGVLCAGSSPRLRDMRFVENVAEDGIVHCSSSTMRVEDVEITGSGEPGPDTASLGMLCDGASCRLSRVTFSGLVWGGLRCINGSNATLTDCEFLANLSAGHFGGLYCEDSSPSLDGVLFEGNRSAGGVGGMLCVRSSPYLSNVTFRQNEVGGGVSTGGMSCTEGSSPTLTDVEFIDNTGNYTGGLRCTGNSCPELAQALFEGNYASNGDGGMTCIDSSPVLHEVVLRGNSSDLNAPGLGAYGSSSPLLEYVTFTENADHEGCPNPSALGCFSGATPVLRNCTFAANSNVNGTGGAIWCRDGSPSLENCIVAYTERGAAVWCSGSALPVFTNCYVFGNAGGDSLCGAHYDNMFLDPLFCDLPNGNLALRDDSPCLPENNSWGELVGAYGAGGCGTAVLDEPLPGRLALVSVTPNPFRGSSSIGCDIPGGAGDVRVAVYDLAGRRIRVLADGLQPPGRSTFAWDGNDDGGRAVASGAYFCRVTAGAEEVSAKIVLIR